MTTPYTTKDLDALILACIEFTDRNGEYFYAGNVVPEGMSQDQARRMLDWVAEIDKGLLEYRGFGNDNVEYFRLGLDARQMTSNGGFEKYLRGRARKEYREGARLWAPIFISLLALVVSVLGLLVPKDSAEKIDDLYAQLNALRSDQGQTGEMIKTIRANIETISSRLPKKQRSNR